MQHCNYLVPTMTMQTQPRTDRVLPSQMTLFYVPGLLVVGKMGLLISFTQRLSPCNHGQTCLFILLFCSGAAGIYQQPRLQGGVSITDRKKVCGILNRRARWLILDISVIIHVNIIYRLSVQHFFRNLSIKRNSDLYWFLQKSV